MTDAPGPTKEPTAPTDPTDPTPRPPDRPTFAHGRQRHGLIGPFGGRQITMGILLIAAVVVALVAITAPLGNTGALAKPDPRPTPFLIGPAAEGLHVGDLAPDFQVQRADGSTFRLTDLDGNPVNLADLRGKVVWINFWASWCPPCRLEMPDLVKAYTAHRAEGFVLLGINATPLDSLPDVKAFVKEFSMNFPVLLDGDGSVEALYRLRGLPLSVFVDRQGLIRRLNIGAMSADQIEQYIGEILK